MGQLSCRMRFDLISQSASTLGKWFLIMLTNLAPVSRPSYCSHKTTPGLYEIPTMNATEHPPLPSFFPFAVQWISSPSFRFRQTIDLGELTWSCGLDLQTNDVLSTNIPMLLVQKIFRKVSQISTKIFFAKAAIFFFWQAFLFAVAVSFLRFVVYSVLITFMFNHDWRTAGRFFLSTVA